MPMFSTLDYVALAWFIGAWAVYSITLSLTERRMQGLNSEMNRYRDVWMFQMLARDMRMVDAQIVAALQNGTAFFASTSLLAIGAAFAFLTTSDQVINAVQSLPFPIGSSRSAWETKAIGLLAIYAYAFFKFGWSYRLFNYTSILIGAVPFAAERDSEESRRAVERALQFQ